MASTRAPRRSATVAVLLSFIWPGLGHAYQRRYRSALIYALPMIAVLAYVGLGLAQRGLQGMALDLFDPSYAQTVFVLGILLGVWRLVAMVDAWLFARRAGSRGALAAGVLAVLAVAGHRRPRVRRVRELVLLRCRQPHLRRQRGRRPPLPGPRADPEGSPGRVADARAHRGARRSTRRTRASDRISVLLMGIDSSKTRAHSLTDTLLVVSVDPETKTGAMVSIPRDVGQLPLYDGGTYAGKINSLLSYARRNPKEFPDGATTTLVKEVGHLVGVPVHYYAAVNLDGFVKLVDLVGGVTVDNPRAINDPRYGGWTDGRPVGFKLAKGTPEARRPGGARLRALALRRRGQRLLPGPPPAAPAPGAPEEDDQPRDAAQAALDPGRGRRHDQDELPGRAAVRDARPRHAGGRRRHEAGRARSRATPTPGTTRPRTC